MLFDVSPARANLCHANLADWGRQDLRVLGDRGRFDLSIQQPKLPSLAPGISYIGHTMFELRSPEHSRVDRDPGKKPFVPPCDNAAVQQQDQSARNIEPKLFGLASNQKTISDFPVPATASKPYPRPAPPVRINGFQRTRRREMVKSPDAQ